MKRLLFALFLVACSPEIVDPVETIAQPITQTYTSPSVAPCGTLAVVGTNNGNRLVYWDMCSGYCTWHWLGSPTMTDSIVVRAGSASWADMRAVAYNTYFAVNCSGGTYGAGVFYMYSPEQGTKMISLEGTSAGDYFLCSGGLNKDVSCHGFGGSDIFESNDCNTAIYGGPGNDKIRMTGGYTCIGTTPYLQGEDGDDCLTAPASMHATYGCGNNNDTANASGSSCETVTPTTCP